MTDLNIDIKSVRNINHSIPPLIAKLSSTEKRLNMIKWKITDQQNASCNAYARLEYISKSVLEAKKNLEEIYKVSSESVEQYSIMEAKLYEKAKDNWVD